MDQSAKQYRKQRGNVGQGENFELNMEPVCRMPNLARRVRKRKELKEVESRKDEEQPE